METKVSISACRTLQEALTDRTRGLIFHEFLIGGELTASIVSSRLGVTFTSVSYHIRRLFSSGIIESTREVVAGYRTEKFYRIVPELISLLLATPHALTEAYADMAAEERQTVHCTFLAIAASMLARASEHYQAMDPDEFDRLFSRDRLMMLGFGTMPRESFQQLVRIARAALPETWGDLDAERLWAHPDYMIFAALPELVAHSNGDRS